MMMMMTMLMMMMMMMTMLTMLMMMMLMMMMMIMIMMMMMTMLMMMMIMMMMMMMMMTLLMLMMQAEKQKSEVLVQCQKIVTERDEAVQGNKFLQSKLREAEIALKELGQNVCNRQHSQISNAFGRSSNLTWVKLLTYSLTRPTQPPIISGMQMSSA